jgi:hypothetical protein
MKRAMGMWPRAFVACAAVLSATSCRQVLGIEDRHEAQAGDGGVDSIDQSACAACREGSCSGESASCAGTDECEPAVDCVGRCAPKDAECVAWCLGSIGRSDALADLVACSTGSCGAKCGGGECGELRFGSSDCDACIRENCCDENAACSADSDCAKLDYCDKRCLPAGSTKCTQACEEQFSGGGDAWAARNACANSRCADVCTAGHAWSCLDDRRSYELPTQSGTVTLEMSVAEFLSNTPYVGVTVKACERRQFDCNDPYDTAITDDDGRFSLEVPLSDNGFDGYLDFNGKDIYPALYYFAPPIVAGGPRGHLQLPSQANLGVLVGLLGIEADPTTGHLALVAWDCTLAPAPGVSLSLLPDDEGATRYYFRDQAPSVAPTQTGANPALGGYANVRANRFVLVQATVAAGSKPITQTQYYIRPGTLTTSSMPPSPTAP